MKRHLLTSLLVVPLAACGATLDEEDARVFWGSVESSLGESGGGGNTLSSPLSVGMEFEADCRNGGSVYYDGQLDADAGDGVLASTFDWHVSYEECSPDENTLDGDLDYKSALEASAGDGAAQLQYLYTWSGLVLVTGETEGECEFDVRGSVTASAFANEEAAGHDVEVVYTGYLCGHDAEEVLDERYTSKVRVEHAD